MSKITLIILVGLCSLVILPSCRYSRISDRRAERKYALDKLHPRFIYVFEGKIRLHYIKTGNDTLPTLFIIHGSPGTWKRYIRYLKDTDLLKHFRIIAIDRPGFGYSDQGHPFHLEEQAQLIYGIVQQEQNGKPFHLVGHSLGGPVVVKLAQDHPEAYASLTILAGSISPYDEPKEHWRKIFVHNPLEYLLPEPYRTCNTEIWYFKKDLYEMDNNYNRLTMAVTFIHGDKDPLLFCKST